MQTLSLSFAYLQASVRLFTSDKLAGILVYPIIDDLRKQSS